MTHEGRMQRGEENFKNGLINNSDTKYYLDNKKDDSGASNEELDVSENNSKKKTKRGGK